MMSVTKAGVLAHSQTRPENKRNPEVSLENKGKLHAILINRYTSYNLYYILLDRICSKALVDGAISIQIDASVDREMPATALTTLKTWRACRSHPLKQPKGLVSNTQKASILQR